MLVNAAAPGICATDINGHTGYRTAARGAARSWRIWPRWARTAPTGGFFGEDGPLPW